MRRLPGLRHNCPNNKKRKPSGPQWLITPQNTSGAPTQYTPPRFRVHHNTSLHRNSKLQRRLCTPHSTNRSRAWIIEWGLQYRILVTGIGGIDTARRQLENVVELGRRPSLRFITCIEPWAASQCQQRRTIYRLHTTSSKQPTGRNWSDLVVLRCRRGSKWRKRSREPIYDPSLPIPTGPFPSPPGSPSS